MKSVSKLKKLIKKHWIDTVLVLCLFSSFASPVLSMVVPAITLGALLVRAFFINSKKRSKA